MLGELKRGIGKLHRVTLVLAAANIAVFLVLSLLGDTQSASFMYSHGAAYAPDIKEGAWWLLFTSMFLHFGPVHLAYNMLCLISLGDLLEGAIGSVRFILIYFIGGLAAGGASVWWELHTGRYAVSAGASGAIFALIGALLWVVIKNRGRLGRISLQRMLLTSALMLAQGFTEAGTDNAAHVGGFAAGLLLCMIIRKRS